MSDLTAIALSTDRVQSPTNASRTAEGERPETSKASPSAWRSRDGDTVELGKGCDPAEKGVSGPHIPVQETEDGAEPEKTKSWAEVREIIEKVRGQLRQQQMDQIRSLLGEADSRSWEAVSKDGHGNTTVINILVRVVQDGKAVPADAQAAEGEAPKAGASTLDPYWNAENTANRIVQFAMRFAEAHGDDPESFAETIKAAVERGFAEAHAITGDLPGAAGDLNRDTHGLTFKKLEESLDAWQASLYNQPAQPMPSGEGQG